MEGWPELIVLDSTIPARIASVVESIDPARTLFLVSSKSGTTIEPNMLYKFFRSVVEDAVGAENAGGRFVAITDADTALEELAQEDRVQTGVSEQARHWRSVLGAELLWARTLPR